MYIFESLVLVSSSWAGGWLRLFEGGSILKWEDDLGRRVVINLLNSSNNNNKTFAFIIKEAAIIITN